MLLLIAIPASALTPAQVFNKAKDSLVVVKTFDSKGEAEAQGSGVSLPSGVIVTNCHVLENAKSYKVARKGQFVSATLYANDADKDLCLLKAYVPETVPVQLGKTSALRVGDPVYAIGSPRGLELSLSDGIVSQLRGAFPPIIQTTAAISPGSSGGGLFNAEGQLVGITTYTVKRGQNLNFAIPVEWLDEISPDKRIAAKERSRVDWLAEAVIFGDQKNWQGLLDWCRDWTRVDSESYWAWFCVGEAYTGLNRYKEAIEANRSALRIKPNASEAWTNLGYIYSELNHHSDAIEAYRTALRNDPKNTLAWHNLGSTYIELDRFTDAVEPFRTALRIRPDYFDAWINLGIAYNKLARHSDAIEAYQAALRINPNDASAWYAWYNIGNTYVALDRHADAIEAFRTSLRFKGNSADAWYNLGVTYNKLSRYSEAIEAYRAALRINPNDSNVWSNLAVTYAQPGNREAAMRTIQELRRYDPHKAEKITDAIFPK